MNAGAGHLARIRTHVLVGVLALLVGLAGCGGGSKSASTGEHIDDSVITAKVKTALTQELGAGTLTGISVETFKGRVQLSGFVDSASVRNRAGATAAGVKGVRHVDNQLAIK